MSVTSNHPIVSYENTSIVLKDAAGKDPFIEISEFHLYAGKTAYVEGAPASGKTILLNSIRQNRFSKDKRIKYPFQRWQQSGSVMLIEQGTAIIKEMTVVDNILLPLKNRNIRNRHKTVELLTRYGLGDKRNKKAAILSYSEIFNLQLIRAELMLPLLLLIDDIDRSSSMPLMNSVLSLISLITANDGAVIATGYNASERFDESYRLDSGKLRVASI